MPPSLTDKINQDFKRDVYCLFGLTVDNLTLESTKLLLRERASQESSTVLSTINVNWVVQSLTNPEFRAAILNSDIVTLDGRPLLWLSKLLGYPMQETVPGSTLIQELYEEKADKPLSIFLFGGEEGAAEQAMNRINQNQCALKAVGALNPGFGTVEEMSTKTIVQAINKTEPDILLVALGAKKGTQWIEHNRHRLNAKIISHLGATINFLAGTVKRAPRFTQSIGMEWLWRIFQEPKLFTRYASDGLVLLRLVANRSFLWLQFLFWQKRFNREQPDEKIICQEYDEEVVLSFGKNIQLTEDSPIRHKLNNCAHSGKNITLDFQKTAFADGAFMSLLLLLDKHQRRNGNKLAFVHVQNKLSKMFHLFGVYDKMRGKGK